MPKKGVVRYPAVNRTTRAVSRRHFSPSQYGADAGFDGAINEFRIYDAALTADEVAYSFGEGPNADLFTQ